MAPENPSMTLDSKYDHYEYPTTSPNKQNGHPGHTTPEQDAQVYQLRMQLEQAGYKDRLDTLTMVCSSYRNVENRPVADGKYSYGFCEHGSLMSNFQDRCR